MTASLLSRSRLARIVLVAGAAALFLILAWPGAASRGILGEEVQPFLGRYPVVLEWASGDAAGGEGGPLPLGPGSRVARMPPYEEGALPPPRWVATSQWPVIAYDGRDRMWPIFIRGHQTALGSYTGILFGPLLGGGIAGPRRATVLLGLLIVVCTVLTALRAGGSWPVQREPSSRERGALSAALAGAIIAVSFGMISIARTAEAFEVSSRAAMMLALLALAPRGPLTLRRAGAAGLAGGLAILCRGTIVVALIPAMAVLLLRRESRPGRLSAAILALLTLALPIVAVGLFSLIVPFRSGSAPLSGFPVGEIPSRMLAVPRQAVLTLAWLGDATSIWGPLLRGAVSLGPTLRAPAVLASLPLAVALYRLARGRAGTGEALYVATLASSVVLGAALYRGADQFQLALAVEPMIALAVGDQLASIKAPRLAWAAGATALAVRAHSAIVGLSLDNKVANPMFSGRSQRAAVARLVELGAKGPEVMTTVYNQAGVIEGWTGGIGHDPALGGVIRPSHAWPVLASSGDDRSGCAMQAAWRALFVAVAPRYIVLTDGPNLYESSDMDPAAIRRSLARAALTAGVQVSDAGRFPTESGGDGWSLVRVDYPAAPGGARELPADPACAEEDARRQGGALRRDITSFRGLRRGDVVGLFQIEAIEAQGTSVLITVRKGEGRAVFELRPAPPGSPAPPAMSRGLGVFYRNQDADRFGGDELVRAAQAIAERLTP